MHKTGCLNQEHKSFSLLLEAAGVRPTRQRLALASILFDGAHKHVTAEKVFEVARARKVGLVLATVYNSLHQFKAAGLLREVAVDAQRRFYDTNCTVHGHVYDAVTETLHDLPCDALVVPDLPSGFRDRKIVRMDVTLWVDKK